MSVTLEVVTQQGKAGRQRQKNKGCRTTKVPVRVRRERLKGLGWGKNHYFRQHSSSRAVAAEGLIEDIRAAATENNDRLSIPDSICGCLLKAYYRKS